MITVYGIKNCDTCRKALKWLEAEGIGHSFHDFRVDGLEAETVAGLLKELGGEALINRRSTSWRGLDDKDRDILNSDDAVAITKMLVDNPTLIKRPVFVQNKTVINGFGASQKDVLTGG